MRALIVVLCIVGCGTPAASGMPDAGPASCSAPGEPSAGPADVHCGPTDVQPTSAASCHTEPDAGVPDAGVACDYGPTLFGTEGDDDDCKYHLAWTSTPICEGAQGVDFSVVVTSRVDGSAVTGGAVRAETFVSVGDACDVATRHVGPNTFTTLREGPPGTYAGPVVFDEPGSWTLRFHVFDDCLDDPPDSPHGHAAFRLTVP